MIVRPMEARDIDRVADLITQLGYPATPQDIARRFARLAGRDDQILLVAVDDRGAIGWLHVAAHPSLEHDDSAEIVGLVVADGDRSRGVGAALVAEAAAWSDAHGCTALRVRSRIERGRAHAFYERQGFQRIKTQHSFRKPLGG
jgi:ribosomal protein S18 acetylase RimI-like enzyme